MGVTTGSGGTISSWQDQSGNGNNATQTTASYQPTLTANALNGLPVVSFINNGNYFNLPNLMNGATAGEIFIVVRATSATPSNAPGLLQFSSATGGCYPNGSGDITENFGSTTMYTVGAPPSGIAQYGIYNVSSQSGQWTARLDGLTLLNSASNTVAFGSSPHLGHNSGTGFNGQVAEVIVYNTVLTAAQRATVGQYLESKYNLPGISVPPNPTGLAATPLSATEVSLVWSSIPTNTGITYTVWRATGSGGYSVVAQVSNAESYIDSGLTAGTSYSYELSASTLAGSSLGYSSPVNATTMTSGIDMPLTGMELWLKADSGVCANANGRAVAWLDQSGNGNNGTQTTTSYRPTLTANALNGFPVVSFINNGNYFNLPNLMNGATAGEIFIVVQAASANPSNAPGLFQFGNSTGGCYPNDSGAITENFGSTTMYTLGAPPSGIAQYSIYDVSSQSGQWSARLDGLTLLNSTSNTVAFGSSPHLGHNSSTGFNGEVAEVIVYNTVLTAAQRATVGQYLESKYNLPGISVPSNPTGLAATPLSATQVSLIWSSNSTNTGITYTVWRATGSGGYTAVAQVSNTQSYIDSGLTAGTAYSYELSASTLAGSSPGYSASVIATTMTSGTDMPLTGMELWLKADCGVNVNSSGRAVAWQDQSGNGNNATQTTINYQPTLTANALNGFPVVSFINSGNYFNLPNLMNGATSGEIFIVVQAASATPSNAPGLFQFGSGIGGCYPNNSGVITENFGSTTTYTVGTPPLGIAQYGLYDVSSQSGLWTARMDSVTLLTSTTNSVAFNSSPHLGHNGSSGFNGEVAEVIVYNSVVTAAQRATVAQYLAQKYNLPGISVPTPTPTPSPSPTPTPTPSPALSPTPTPSPSPTPTQPPSPTPSPTPTLTPTVTPTPTPIPSPTPTPTPSPAPSPTPTPTPTQSLSTLPVTIGFEQSEGYALGGVSGQNGWNVSQGSAQITSQTAYLGAQSQELAPGNNVAISAFSFAPVANESVEFCDFYSIPVAEASVTTSTLFSAGGAEFGFSNLNGLGVLQLLQGNGIGGGVWVPTPFTIPLGAGNQAAGWVRLTARLDFGAQTWDMYSNGILVATSIPFTTSPSSYFSTFQVQGDASTPSFIDEVYVGSENPLFADTNNNGVPDSWELLFLGNLGYGRTADPGGVGRSIIQSYQQNLSPWPSPAVPSGLQAWYRSDLGIIADPNNNVSQWTDLSGNGFHLFQTTCALPTFVAGALNGRPALQFVPQQQLSSLIQQNLLAGGNDLTLISVIAPAAAQTQQSEVFSWGLNGSTVCGLSSNSSNGYLLSWPGGDGTIWQTPLVNAIAGGPQILSEVKSGATATAYLNGVAIGSDAVAATIATTTGQLTMGNAAPSFNLGFDGQIAELLVYNRALSDTERQSIEAALTSKYLNPDSNGDGLPDAWEFQYFGTISISPSADYDGNGQTVAQDYAASINPVDYFGGRAFAVLPSGAGNSFTYDLSGRLIATSYSNGANLSFTNDPAGNLSGVANYGGIVQWRIANNLPPDGTGEGADTAILGNDGIPNLAKYAFGLSAATTYTGYCPLVSITGLNGGYLQLAYTSPYPAPTDIVYTVQVSGDGINWSSGSGATVPVGSTVINGIATTTVRDATPIGTPAFGRRIRLSIQRIPQP